jgi:hypothetical protein
MKEFSRDELIELRDKAEEIGGSPLLDFTWARAYLALADAADHLDAMEARTETKEEDVMEEKKNEFAEARKLMWETLSEHRDLYEGYLANIAMLLYDELARTANKYIDLKDPNKRNTLADKILKLIFS